MKNASHCRVTGAAVSLIAGLTAAAAPSLAQEIRTFESDAQTWLDTAPASAGFAFDEFYPGLNDKGDLCDQSVVIDLGVTQLTVRRVGEPAGALRDASSMAQVSDAVLYRPGGIGSRWTFSTPIYGLYTYYGSADSSSTIAMRLYSQGELVSEVSRFGGGLGVYAVGHGFLSDIPIDKIEFMNTGNDPAILIGAFIGLYNGEPSLGRTYIDGYHGPNGSNVDLDFAICTEPLPDFTLEVSPLYAMSTGRFTVTDAAPQTPTYLLYSTTGPGSTYVSQLDVTLNLAAPSLAAPRTITDAIGSTEWALPIPAKSRGMDVWFQVAQPGLVSNVIATTIQ
ncbi:MAG: hypothetical protein D8M59_14825 [Planctomycetes bacterium]|nr:hypothetical protein [Planctomycetota bacterium]NOG55035.1 hypothetical protein [Planctomycetota bacterium]